MASTYALFREVGGKVVGGRNESSDVRLLLPYSFLVLPLAHRARESVVVSLREQKARSLIVPPIVGRAISDARGTWHSLVTDGRGSRVEPSFIAQILTSTAAKLALDLGAYRGQADLSPVNPLGGSGRTGGQG
jgi:hypothetical protein